MAGKNQGPGPAALTEEQRAGSSSATLTRTARW